jgi:hypothetical protein
MPLGFRKKISQPPAEVDASVGIGWLHADSLDRERNAEKSKKEIGKEGNQENPDQEHGCQRGQKELSNAMMDSRLMNPFFTLTLQMGHLPALNTLIDRSL